MAKKRIIVEVDNSLHYIIKKKALSRKMTIKEAMMELINRWLKRT